MPRSEWTIEDDWHGAGQARAGSMTVVIDRPVLPPMRRRLRFPPASSGNAPGTAVNTDPLYGIPFLPVMLTLLCAGTPGPDPERFSASTLIEAGAGVSFSTLAAMDRTETQLTQ